MYIETCQESYMKIINSSETYFVKKPIWIYGLDIMIGLSNSDKTLKRKVIQ